MNELLHMNIVPILNANDVVAEPPHQDADLKEVSWKLVGTAVCSLNKWMFQKVYIHVFTEKPAIIASDS